MAGSHASLIVMPIVIAVALAFWISLVYRASFHPRWRHHARPRRTDVAGGVFEATHSARQLEPLWGEPVEPIPQPREGAYAESYRAADARIAEDERQARSIGAGARSGATATGSVATGARPPTESGPTGSRPPTESGPTGSGWPAE